MNEIIAYTDINGALQFVTSKTPLASDLLIDNPNVIEVLGSFIGTAAEIEAWKKGFASCWAAL